MENVSATNAFVMMDIMALAANLVIALIIVADVANVTLLKVFVIA